MKNKQYLWTIVVALIFLLVVGCGGPTQICNPGDTWSCTCGTVPGTQSCLPDGMGYSTCQCKSPIQTQGQPPLPRRTLPPEPPGPEPVVDASSPPEPAKPEQSLPPESPTTQDQPGPITGCPGNSFFWEGQCYLNTDFCNSTTGNPNFPVFTADGKKAMRQPYVIEFDATTKKPLFCQTRQGYYYLSNFGYGNCDNDGDGWINIFANQAVTSTDAQIRQNARCNLRKIEAIVYLQDGQKHLEEPNQKLFLQKLKTPVSLVETDKNDGLGKLIDMPVYTENQASLPTTPGSACTQDADCDTTKKEVCYRGNCVAGRRFKPEEINTFTKACIAGIDLNDNRLDDANETPDSKPNPSTEFTPLLKLAYFIELHFGYYQPLYRDGQGGLLSVWVLNERARQGGPANRPSSLALQLPEDPNGFQPDYWRSCGLRDNQQCADPTQPGKQKRGLSLCWMDQVKRAIPSLFQCVTFDATTDKTTQAGYFHPDNYGAGNNYVRTICSLSGTWKNPDNTSAYQADFQFTCSVDDGKNKPDPSKRTVGWAGFPFKPYAKPGDYLAGCIDEIAHEVCGKAGGVNALTYLQHEKGSYGLARAKRECGPKAGLGVCKSAEQTCSGGQWAYCGVCDSCPQNTPGQKQICPNGVWPRRDVVGQEPIVSCKPVIKPSPEICDGQDNDCDGSVDEGLPTLRYYRDKDQDGFGDKNDPGTQRCKENKPVGSVLNNQDCDDNNKNIHPQAAEVCDGVDNNCDGKRDENSKQWYIDRDKDGFGDKQAKVELEGCQRADKKICTGPNQCVDPMDKSGTYPVVTNNQDCCDRDARAKPGQTQFFSTQVTNCGGYDYNCDGKETVETKVCQCSKRITFWDVSTVANSGFGSMFYLEFQNVSYNPPKPKEKGSFAPSLHSSYVNLNNCQFVPTGSFTYSNSKSEFYSNLGSLLHFTLQQDLVKRTWTWPQSPTDSSNQPYLMWETYSRSSKPVSYSQGCLFRLDGNLAKCGDTNVYPAPPIDKQYLSKTFKEANTLSGHVLVLSAHRYNYTIHIDGEIRTQAVMTRSPLSINPNATTTVVKCQ